MSRLILKFPADHPVAAGHFPGNPVIPGALLLAEVTRSIEEALGRNFATCTVKAAKFHYPVRPGNDVEVEFTCSTRHEIDFDCAVSGKKVLSGAIVATLIA